MCLGQGRELSHGETALGHAPTTPEPPQTQTHLRHKAGGCSGSRPAGPSEDTSARGQASSIMRTTTSSRTGKSVSVMTATCGQGTVTRGAVPQAPHARPTLPQLPDPFLVPPAAAEGTTWRWGLSPGGRRPAQSQHPSRQPAHSQHTAPLTPADSPPTPSRRPRSLPAHSPAHPSTQPRPLPAHSPPEPPAPSAPTWAHFSCHGRHRAARTGLGPQGEGDPRTSQPQKVRDGVSKATGLVQRTQGAGDQPRLIQGIRMGDGDGDLFKW